jgi:hypothetical protein
MAATRPPGSMGLDMRSRGTRQCGLCGQHREMTKAHVPPQAAGNTAKVTSSIALVSDGVLRTGRQSAGGMWVRGLCEPCNGLAGQRYDTAYGEFAKSLDRHTAIGRRLHLLRPWEPPAVRVAPGLVSRAILFGLFAVSPHLRVIFPDLARDLLTKRDHIQMPPGATLRFALYSQRSARVAGPISAHRVLTRREDFDTFGEVFFRPLAWVLAPTRPAPTSGLSVLDAQGWACADEWLQYGPDVVSTDLRNLTRRLPVVTHPLAGRREEWIEMFSDEITPVLEGLIPA